jgi:hypothetical protein
VWGPLSWSRRIRLAASYLVAHRVTTALVEPRPERGPQHDIR